MKNKIVTLPNNIRVPSCGTCHTSTINDGWCVNCIDIKENKFTCNPVQSDAYKILQDKPTQSIIVASKTGTGKTWIAYQAIRKFYEYLESNFDPSVNKPEKIIWLNPLKQIVREKVEELRDTFPDKKILELTGDTSDEVGFGKRRNQFLKDNDIIVCSYEMFDSLTRNPGVYTELNNIGQLVVDEIHSIGDLSRGGKLDGAITRFLLKHHNTQIVALSATFDNLQDLEKYFNQFLDTPIVTITSKFTPIKVNVDQVIHTYDRDNLPLFIDIVGAYLKIPGGIMCMQLSIPGCKKLAEALNATYGDNTARVHFSELQKDDKYKTVNDFNDGAFKVLCCTPTLLAGVNVAATVIILNVSYFSALTLEDDVLPQTSIRQAIGRVGRPPRYKEGWVSYICKTIHEDTVRDVLVSPNVIRGSLNSALEQVLNIEVSMKSQSNIDLKNWYEHTYSGFSSTSNEERYHQAVMWLISNKYIQFEEPRTVLGNNAAVLLTILPKGRACAKYFLNPMFFEDTIKIMNESVAEDSPALIVNIETLAQMGQSPFNFNERKKKQFDEYAGFNWMRDQYGNFDWTRIKPQVQWAEQIQFAMNSVAQAAKDLKMPNLEINALLINICMEQGLIPIPLIKLKLFLDKVGIPYLGSKYLLYLHLNNVKVDDKGILTGPQSFKTPTRGTYIMSDDDYYNRVMNDTDIRYMKAAESLKKYYGEAGIVKVLEESEW